MPKHRVMNPLSSDTEQALAESRFITGVKTIRDMNLCHRDGRPVALDELYSWAGISAKRGEELLRALDREDSAGPHKNLLEAKPSLKISQAAVAKKEGEEKKHSKE
jgi:hypothetical protein